MEIQTQIPNCYCGLSLVIVYPVSLPTAEDAMGGAAARIVVQVRNYRIMEQTKIPNCYCGFSLVIVYIVSLPTAEDAIGGAAARIVVQVCITD
jgi:hypothetical protein